jgi:hypothetical protein
MCHAQSQLLPENDLMGSASKYGSHGSPAHNSFRGVHAAG